MIYKLIPQQLPVYSEDSDQEAVDPGEQTVGDLNKSALCELWTGISKDQSPAEWTENVRNIDCRCEWK